MNDSEKVYQLTENTLFSKISLKRYVRTYYNLGYSLPAISLAVNRLVIEYYEWYRSFDNKKMVEGELNK